MDLTIRPASSDDASLILMMIKELACYENLEHEVSGTVEDLHNTLFNQAPTAYAVIAEEKGIPVGFALYFFNYSTFLCKPGLYIEDIYIREQCRGKGYGQLLLKHLCALALEKNCGRVEWWCLDWNKKSIDFYLKLGAQAMDEWTVYRLTQTEMRDIVSNR